MPFPEDEPPLTPEQADQLWARIKLRFAERRRYSLPPARSLSGLRKSCLVSQHTLAARLGLRQTRLSKFERETNPQLDTLKAYISALGGSLLLIARFPDRDVHLE